MQRSSYFITVLHKNLKRMMEQGKQQNEENGREDYLQRELIL